MRAAEDVSSETVGTVPRIIHRIKLREAWVAALVVGIVLQGNIGKTVGIENEVAADWSSGRNLANGGQVWVGVGYTAVDCGNNRGQLPGVEHADRRNNGGVGKNRIAGARGSGICRVNGISQPCRDVEGEAGAPGHDGINAPPPGQPLWAGGPHPIKRQIPASAEADSLPDIAVSGGVEKVWAISRHLRVALGDTRRVVQIVAVGVGKSEIRCAQLGTFGLPGEACLKSIVVCIRYILEFG